MSTHNVSCFLNNSQISTMTDGRYPYFYRLLLKIWSRQMTDFWPSMRKSGMTDDRLQLFPVTQSSMTDYSFFWFSPQNLNMTDDSFTVPTTKLYKTYQERWQISAFFVSFWRIPSMTDDSFSTFVTQNLSMTDDRWQLFLGLSPSFLPRQMTAFFATFVNFGMTDYRFSTTVHIFQPWQITAFDVLEQNILKFY